MKIQGAPIIAGSAEGEALVSSEPLSFWGGYDQFTGEIIDRRHPLSGVIAAGKVLALPFSRGSSAATAVLLESIRAETAPAAILTSGTDPYFSLAAIVADEMYGKTIPILALSAETFAQIQTGQWIRVQPDGTLTISPPSSDRR